MQSITPLNRRDFIRTSGGTAAAVVAGTLAAPAILRGATPTAEPVRIGHIGVGVRGTLLLGAASSNPGCKIVAVCDVYQPHLRKAAEAANNPDVKSYNDYHDLLNDPKVEAVVIATPDHWHEAMVLDAIAAGKDVYCEKGWTTSVAAAKRMRAAIKKAGTVFQLGHQGRQLAAADVARKMLLDGAIGEVTLVNLGRFFNGTPEHPPWRWYGSYGNFIRPDPQQVIKELDWERWLGPAPKIDFNERHFWHWRCYFPYGTGQAGDLLSHEMDLVQSVLRYGIPDTCTTHAHNAFWKDDREAPDTWLSSYVFEKPNCSVTFEGCMNSRRQQTPEFIGRNGRLIFSEIGQNASLFETYADGPAYRPARYPQPQPDFFFTPGREHRKPDHFTDFLNCVRTRGKTQCNEEEAFIEAATLLMSFESFRLKRMVRWDATREEIV
ncbi:MAG: Gfo/Idh/MocA family oxidoreductase [Akkermansiaceae bacterium]|jgi:predicted dehydrogenase|nr:Gfo/Idh/MocA family oxidoreductase [Akkermansiaceae bacterium]